MLFRFQIDVLTLLDSQKAFLSLSWDSGHCFYCFLLRQDLAVQSRVTLKLWASCFYFCSSVEGGPTTTQGIFRETETEAQVQVLSLGHLQVSALFPEGSPPLPQFWGASEHQTPSYQPWLCPKGWALCCDTAHVSMCHRLKVDLKMDSKKWRNCIDCVSPRNWFRLLL